MFVLATWIALLGLCIYRALILALPFFHEAIAQAPVLNILCGTFSDLSLGMVLTFLWLLGARSVPEKYRRALGTAVLVATAFWVYSLAAHIRYVEHFGMNARPYHTVAMENGEMWLVGTMMVLTSARAWMIIGPLVVALVVGWNGAQHVERRWIARPRKQAAKRLVACLLIAWIAHMGMIQLRTKPGMHNELRYSVYASLYYNYQDFKHVKAVPMPTPEQLAKLRTLLPGPRSYAEGEVGHQYPLWQTEISAPASASPAHEALRKGLRDFIAEKAHGEGPWNVIVLLSESLRANELASMGPVPPEHADLTPNLSRIATDGVRFTEVISAGLRTHFGQTASQCSLNGALDFSILQGAPMSDAVCLGDVFSRKGYETFFFYAADNHFDNQDVFYLKHGMQHVFGQEHFPKDAPKGGWGYSDAALFRFAETQMAAAKKPFFALVMTLTNHPPIKIPDDVPPGLVKEGLIDRVKMIQYVDWTTGEFYDKLKRDFPRTLLFFIADHGQYWEDEGFPDQIPDYARLRKIARIPFFVVPIHPDLPDHLKNQTIDTLTSNVDVPPTLFSLLGWHTTPQQFMGMDAFARGGPVYIDWFNKLLQIDALPDGGRTITQVDAEREELIGTAGRYNLLAPSHQ
jgi:phosphoglycerol transferase MdoB-like AlkP superfamily enzyme